MAQSPVNQIHIEHIVNGIKKFTPIFLLIPIFSHCVKFFFQKLFIVSGGDEQLNIFSFSLVD